RDLCAVAPVRGAWIRFLPRVLPVAPSAAASRAPPLPAPLSRPCTTLWCDKPSLPALENLQPEPRQIPLPRFSWTSTLAFRNESALRRSIAQFPVDYARSRTLS